MTHKIEKVVYQAHATATGGRDGSAKSSDGLLDVKLTVPKEMGGAGGGVNPEQLFAAGYSACFIGAMKFVAGTQKIALPADMWVEVMNRAGSSRDAAMLGIAVMHLLRRFGGQAHRAGEPLGPADDEDLAGGELGRPGRPRPPARCPAGG